MRRAPAVPPNVEHTFRPSPNLLSESLQALRSHLPQAVAAMELCAGAAAGAADCCGSAAAPPPLRAAEPGGAAPQLVDTDLPFFDCDLEGHRPPLNEWEHAPLVGLQTVPPEPAVAPVQWRCLDIMHAASCSRCTPAPAPHEAPRFELIDAAGNQTEKRLRTQLTRCAEWNDSAECARLVAALEAEEAASGKLSGVVDLLRTHKVANMRKLMMLRLAHQWNYRSDCWHQRVDGAPRKRRRNAGSPVTSVRTQSSNNGAAASRDWPEYDAAVAARGRHGVVVAALCARPFTALQVAQGQVMQLITARVDAAAHFWAGAASCGEFQRAHGLGMSWVRSFAMGGALEVARWMSAVFEMRLQSLRAWRDSLSAESLREPAYMTDGAYNSPSSELEAIKFILVNSAAATHDTIPHLLQADGRLRPQDAAWMDDYDAGHNCIMVMVASVHAYMTMQRQQPLSTYLEAADAALVGMCDYARKATVALTRRVEWTAAMAELQGPAAGDKLQAKAMIPPMVQRLRLNGGQDMLALATSATPLGQPPVAFSLCTQRPAAARTP